VDVALITFHHRRMARGGHGLPKVSPGPAMPYLSMPCGRATPKTALQLFQGWSAQRVGGLRPSSIPLNTPRHTPLHFPPSTRLILDPASRLRTEDEEQNEEEETKRTNGGTFSRHSFSGIYRHFRVSRQSVGGHPLNGQEAGIRVKVSN
jgi:hypothetical protein